MTQNNENPFAEPLGGEQPSGRKADKKVRRTLGRFFEKTMNFLGAVELGLDTGEHSDALDESSTTHRDITNGTILPQEHPDARAHVSLEPLDQESELASQYTGEDKFDRMQLYPDSHLTAKGLLHYRDNRRTQVIRNYDDLSIERFEEVRKNTQPPHDPTV